MDLLLDQATRDLVLVAGVIPLSSDDSGETTAQRLRIRFAFFLGEYFADTRQGVPYFRDILGQKFKRAEVSAVFRRVITTTPGIASLDAFDLGFDSRRRVLSLTFRAILNSGQVFDSADFGPFLVEF